MNPTFCNPKPCRHLKNYRQSQGLNGYSSLQALLVVSPNGRAAVGKLQSLVSICDLCTARGCLRRSRRRRHRRCRRLYLCLICRAMLCSDHAPGHPRSHPGHEIAVDVERAELFCWVCRDQVYDPDFDNAVTAKQFLELPSSSKNGCGRKRKPADAQDVKGPGDLVAGNDGNAKNRSWDRLGLRGLNNLGNTCFMNSVLQALFHAPPLKSYFQSDWHDQESCQRQRSQRQETAAGEGLSCLSCAVDRTFAEMFSGLQTPYSPAHFLYSWWQHSSDFASYQQHDAHDFFISILNTIHEKRVDTQNKATGDCHCIAHTVFSGLLRSDVTCTICGFTSTTYDPCLDISLELEPLDTIKSENDSRSSTLLRCLNLFTRSENLGSDQKLYCKHCEMPQDTVKQMSIRRLPLVLCFHIKRFEHSVTSRTSKKIDQFLPFPFCLDMTPYLSYSVIRNRFGNRIFAFESDEPNAGSDSSSEFEVFAVISHSGSLEAGHYVTYLRLEDQWYKCDDAWINQVSEGVVRASQGYMMYYVQKQRK